MNHPTRYQRHRHALLSAWRGALEPPILKSKARTAAQLVPGILTDCRLEERANLEEVLAAWKDIVGEFLYQHSRPDTLAKGVLTVRLLQPAVHHALMMEKPRILARLKEKLAHAGVRELRFRHG